MDGPLLSFSLGEDLSPVVLCRALLFLALSCWFALECWIARILWLLQLWVYWTAMRGYGVLLLQLGLMDSALGCKGADTMLVCMF